jgi:hypothetical protein
MLVDVVVVGTGLLVDDGFGVVEVANVEDTKTVDNVVDEDGIGTGSGAGSVIASTQYDFPTIRLPHSAVIEGFYWLS